MTEDFKKILETWKAKVVEVVLANPDRSYQDIGEKEFGVSASYIAQIARSAGVQRPLGTKARRGRNNDHK
jgi:hypothetical protein